MDRKRISYVYDRDNDENRETLRDPVEQDSPMASKGTSCRVIKPFVRLRETIEDDSPTLGILTPEDKLTVINRRKSKGQTYYCVVKESSGESGYVNSQYIELEE